MDSITVRTTIQPDRDLEVTTLAELKDLARHGLLVDVDVPRTPTTSPDEKQRQPNTAGE